MCTCLVIGHWGSIPWFAKSPKLPDSTCSARSEEMAHKASFKLTPDQQDKRSVIPIESHDIEQWLMESPADAHELLKLAPAGVFDAGPAQ